MKNIKLKLLVMLSGLYSLGISQADTTSSNMQITSTVASFCEITAASLNFNSFEQTFISQEIEITAQVSPICTKGTPYSISFDSGLNSDGTIRKMKHSTDPTELLTYTLKQDNRTVEILINEISYNFVGTGRSGVDQSFNTIGIIDSSQRVIAGAYSDTVTVTISY